MDKAARFAKLDGILNKYRPNVEISQLDRAKRFAKNVDLLVAVLDCDDTDGRFGSNPSREVQLDCLAASRIVFQYLEDNEFTYSSEEAFDLMNSGIWMTSGGFTWRNINGHGEYHAAGDYPNCIRTCDEHTLDAVNRRHWKIWKQK